MKNLLNCHSIGLHSFPVSLEGGLYKRIFVAEEHHNLWKVNPLEIAIYPHHVDINIRVLEGELLNITYTKDPAGDKFKAFKWNSVIMNGKGGFEDMGEEHLTVSEVAKLTFGSIHRMKACELHTVYVKKGERCIWMIEESAPTCDYFPLTYSNHDLTTWTSEGLYLEVGDDVKEKYIGHLRPRY